MKLIGLKLEVLNIHRKGIFDMDAMVFCCDNCGRAIVNSATVKDIESGKTYVIGLDCKATLVDKPKMAALLSGDFMDKYKVKEFKRDCNELAKVMKYLDNPDKYEVYAESGNWAHLIVYDNTQADVFGNMGKTVYNESLGYLFKIGLKDVLQSAVNKGIIKPTR